MTVWERYRVSDQVDTGVSVQSPHTRNTKDDEWHESGGNLTSAPILHDMSRVALIHTHETNEREV
jgi:hypothetical protein